MIIILIAIFTLLTFFSFIYIKKQLPRLTAGIISFVCLCLIVMSLMLHFVNHWGMKEVTTTKTQSIYSAGPSALSFNLMMTQRIGDQTVLIYRTSEKAKRPIVSAELNTDPTSTSFLKDNAAQKNSRASYKMIKDGEAKLVTRTTTRQFSNTFSKILFSFGDEDNAVVKTNKTAELPQDSWLVLTSEQAKKLESTQAKLQAEAEKAKADLKAALAAAPSPEIKAEIEAKTKASMTPAAQIMQIKQLLKIKN
ncbi:MAG: DUF4811 domain-containing protein [Streptococcaceae bacterium]|jgi:hypothetical protein|nr:DUF4811 domain-containing protein [Streptococcaceae bacterium]